MEDRVHQLGLLLKALIDRDVKNLTVEQRDMVEHLIRNDQDNGKRLRAYLALEIGHIKATIQAEKKK